MHVEFNTKELQEAVKAVKKIFAKGLSASDKPDNSKDCLLASKKDGFIIESAKFGLYFKAKINATVTDDGKFVIDRNLLSDAELSGDTTVFKLKDDNSLDARSGTFHGVLRVNQESDMILTQRPTGIPEISIEIPSEVLQRGIKRISFNPVIEKGRDLKLQVVVHDKHLIMTTNDSYRVAIFEADLDQDVEDACIVTTCPFFLSVVSAIPGDEKVGLGFNNKGLRIRGGNLDVYQPSLQEIEPKDIQAYVQKIQEQTPKISCRASVVEAKRAIREVSSIVPSSFGDTKLGLKFDPRGKVTAKVESSLGETDSSFESQDVKLAGENNRVFFNSRHMYEFLNMLDGEVDMKIWENESILHSEALATTMVITQLT